MPVSFAKSIDLASQAGKQLGNSILELVLPPACRLCNEPIGSGDFCRTCHASLTLSESMMGSACRRCGIPKARSAGDGRSACHESPAGQLVGDGPKSGADQLSCDDRQNCEDRPNDENRCVHCQNLEFAFSGVAALWSYHGRVCEAVVAAKYAHQSPLADALGRRLAGRVHDCLLAMRSESAQGPDLVTSVPSHLIRQFARGGNGNETIAGAVAGQLGRPFRPLLRMTRRIAKQAWLQDDQRLENVRGAFSLKKSYAFARPLDIANRHILLVDDVLTTGATANEVARVLREGGARKVSLAVVARSLRSH